MGQRPSALSRQALYFLLVGAAAAAVHLLALIGAVRLLGFSPAWGNLVAFVPAFAVSFAGHRRLTFRHLQQRGWQASLWRWLLSSAGGFALNQLLFVVALAWLGAAAYVPVWLAVTVLVTLITFALGKFWAFGRGRA